MDKSVKEELDNLKSELENKKREYNNKIKDVYKIKNEIESLTQQNNSLSPSKISYLKQDMVLLEKKIDPLKKEISELERKVNAYKDYIRTSTSEGRRKQKIKNIFIDVIGFGITILIILGLLVSCMHGAENYQSPEEIDEENLKNGLENYKYGRPMSLEEKIQVEKELGIDLDD